MPFIFKKRDPEANPKESVDVAFEEAKNAFDAAVESARLCFNDPKFKKYMEDYAELERATIDRLIKYSNEESDPLKFAFGAKELLQKISLSRAFLVAVKRKAIKTKDEVKTDEQQ